MKLAIFLLTLFVAASAFAACHVITPAGSGAASGADWSNACKGFTGNCAPSSMVRGDSYYVAKGTYKNLPTFNTPDAGTNVISVLAAQATDHCTDSGFVQGAHIGQALFTGNVSTNRGVIFVTSDYWIFSGQYRTDLRDGYGFKCLNDNGTHVPLNTFSCLHQGDEGNPTAAHDISWKYWEVQGSADRSGTYMDAALMVRGGATANDYVGYNWMHDTGAIVLQVASTSSATIEYNWLQNNQSTSTHHAEGVSVTCDAGAATSDLTFRYNYVENMEGTAYIGTPSGSGCNGSGNWDFYGNIFFVNAGDANGQAGAGNGTFSIESVIHRGTVHFYNNTISSMQSDCSVNLQQGVSLTNLIIENNLWYNCASANFSPACPSAKVSGTCTYNHQAYFTMPASICTNDTDPNKQCAASTNPFVLVGQSAGQNNFLLKAATTTGMNLPFPFDQDLNGTTRVISAWDRGALQFAASGGGLPVPPSRLGAIVN